MSDAKLPDEMVLHAIDRAHGLEEAVPALPEFAARPELISEVDASALTFHIGTISRRADEVEAASKAWVDGQRARVATLMKWYGAALLKLAQEKIGKGKPRRLLMPFGALSLRKEPDRLTALEGDEEKRKFRVFDARENHKWTRVKITSDSLTDDEFNQLVNAVPDTLLAKLKWKVEPKKAELIDHWKATGEIPPGFKIEEGTDQLKVDMAIQGDAS